MSRGLPPAAIGRRLRRIFALVLGAVLICGGMVLWSAPRTAAQPRPPLLAYYYIWFDVRSWERAKTDYPALGRYSSDDAGIMREHVRLAQQAGIDGFIVSWKSTPKLNRRLAQLSEIAAAEGFRLAIIYQGLDFERRPLPVDRVLADLRLFREQFAERHAFGGGGPPLVIWSGTWEFSAEDVARVAAAQGGAVRLLASEKNPAGYARVAEHVDGNAYYWSSVDPETFPGYPEKLRAMSDVVHADGGIWIAPAAPGFDARKIGGTRVVTRQGGTTLRRQLEAAAQSAPDVIGLISWNEFSENSQVEPSVDYGTEALEVVAAFQGAALQDGAFPVPQDFDSSAPGETRVRPFPLMILGAFVTIVGWSVAVVVRRGRNERPSARAGCASQAEDIAAGSAIASSRLRRS